MSSHEMSHGQGHGGSGPGAHADEVGHVAPVGIYYAVFATLMVMTAVTVAVAFVDLGPFNTVAALAIAFFKATLVGLYFMHLRWSNRLNGLGILAAVAALALLLFVTLSDYMSRAWMGGP